MSRIGLNHHLTVAKTLRQQTRTLYEGVLGASVMSPRTATEIFRFANGSRIGVSYVEPSEALTPEQHLKAICLEFRGRRRRDDCRRVRSARNAAV